MNKKIELPNVSTVPLAQVPGLDTMVLEAYKRRSGFSQILNPNDHEFSQTWVPVSKNVVIDLQERAALVEKEIQKHWQAWDHIFSMRPWTERGPLDPPNNIKQTIADKVAFLMVLTKEVETVAAAVDVDQKKKHDEQEAMLARLRDNPEGSSFLLDGKRYLDGRLLADDKRFFADGGSVEEHMQRVYKLKAEAHQKRIEARKKAIRETAEKQIAALK